MNATRESFETLPTRPTDYMGWHPMNAGEDIPNPDRWRYMGTLDHRDSDIIA